MAFGQPGVVITQGYGGNAGHWLITQGYLEGDIAIWISPFAPIVAVNSVTHFETNIAANWVLTGAGSLVVAGDNLSADYTAPASPTTVHIKVTDQNDPGNTVTTPVFVTSGGGGGSDAIDIVPPMAGGTNIGRSIVVA